MVILLMNVYPYTSPIILNDQTFVNYGGQTGTTTQFQRQAAYLIAEQQMTNYVGTFLLPTIVTGTFAPAGRVVSDYGYINQVYSVGVISIDSYDGVSVRTQTTPGCYLIWDDTYAYIDTGCLFSACNCYPHVPYQIQIAYQAGLPTGTANQPAFLLALTMAAQISLNEMVYPSQNEGTGDIGISEFTSIGYSEKRVPMGRNAFGTSAKAYKIGQLVQSTVKLARPTLML